MSSKVGRELNLFTYSSEGGRILFTHMKWGCNLFWVTDQIFPTPPQPVLNYPYHGLDLVKGVATYIESFIHCVICSTVTSVEASSFKPKVVWFVINQIVILLVRTFLCMTTLLWTYLPLKHNEYQSISTFKSQLKTHLPKGYNDWHYRDSSAKSFQVMCVQALLIDQHFYAGLTGY